jgi:Tfp pilus assembly protein PilV
MGTSVDKMINFLNKFKNQKGLTLLEALMSTAIVGMGFIAVFNMVNFSVQSIDVSGERTKANYLISMIAEDIIGHKNTVHGADMADEGITFNPEGDVVIKDTTNAEGEVTETETLSYKKFSDHLTDTGWEVQTVNVGDVCDDPEKYKKKTDISNIVDENDEKADAPRNKERKWNEIIGTDRYLKCKSHRDIKKVKVYKLCKWDCTYKITSVEEQNESISDAALFIGRVQFNLNDGRKRRFLYFQADYKLIK